MSQNPSLAALSVVYGRERAAQMIEARTMKRIKEGSPCQLIR
jgi:hypothetical protein